MTEIIYPELSYTVSGLLYKVHNEIGRLYNKPETEIYSKNYLKNLRLFLKEKKLYQLSF